MTQPALAVAACVEEAELECVLWAACKSDCVRAGDAVVSAVALAMSRGTTTELTHDTVEVRDAAVRLIARASFVQQLAHAHSVFVLRESRVPSAGELITAAGRASEPRPDRESPAEAMGLAIAFLAQRIAC